MGVERQGQLGAGDALAAGQALLAAAVGGELVDRRVEDAGLDPVALAQEPADRVAQVGVLEHHRHHVAGAGTDLVVAVGNDDSLDAGEQLPIAAGETTALLDVGAEVGEPGREQRRAGLVEAVVVADVDDVVAHRVAAMAVPGAGCHRVRAEAAGELGDTGVVGRQQPPLPAGEDLVGEEAEGPGEAMGAELALGARQGGVGAVCRVLDQRQAPFLADRLRASSGAA